MIAAGEQRMLTFELGGSHWALPISDVAEITEVGALASVPLLPRSIGGVANHHGDALPVVRGSALLELDPAAASEPTHLLVMARDPDDPGRWGLPVDRIGGLVNCAPANCRGADVIAERRPLDGRLVSVLDPARLRERAAAVIDRAVNGTESTHGGES